MYFKNNICLAKKFICLTIKRSLISFYFNVFTLFVLYFVLLQYLMRPLSSNFFNILDKSLINHHFPRMQVFLVKVWILESIVGRQQRNKHQLYPDNF